MKSSLNPIEADAEIRAAKKQVQSHKDAIKAIRQQILTKYGYTMPGF